MPLPKISNRFEGAVQKTAQEDKITQLQAEISRLRAQDQTSDLEVQIQVLRQNLEQSGEQQVKVSSIDPNLEQPRQTVTNSAINAKARSLKKHGQITPIILIPQESDRYILLDGQLRWEAAKTLGWETIKAVIVPVPQDLNHDSLLTFLHFEDLNPLDKAEAVVREVNKATNLDRGEIFTCLSTVLKRIEREGKSKQLSLLVESNAQEQEQVLQALNAKDKELELLQILLDLGLNPGSVKTNLLPMLSLPNDLKIAIRQQGLKGAHATALSVISGKTLNISEEQANIERIAATQIVLDQDLSVPETKKLVVEIKLRLKPISESKPSKFLLVDRMLTITKQLKQIKELNDAKKQKKLERLLTEIETLIFNN